LRRCSLFVPLLSVNFLRSLWAPQEVGFVVARSEPDLIIAPLSLDGTRSFGFIAHLQSPTVPSDGITEKFLIQPLARRLPRAILPIMINRAAEAAGFRHAEELMQPLVPLFDLFTPEEAQIFAEAAVSNGQIWDALLCRSEYLPRFLAVQESNIREDTLRALRYQLRYGRWYKASEEK